MGRAWDDRSGTVQWSENAPVPEDKWPDLALLPTLVLIVSLR